MVTMAVPWAVQVETRENTDITSLTGNTWQGTDNIKLWISLN